MTSAYAFGRLFWRPGSLGLLYMVALAAGVALSLPAWGEPAAAGAASLVESLSGPALWRLVLVVPFAVGVVSSMLVNEARHTAAAWTLPGFGAALRSGTAVTSAIVATMIGTATMMTRGIFPGIAAFGLTALCFSLGAFVADPLTPKTRSLTTLFALAALAIHPAYLQRVAEWQPLTLTLVAVATAFLLLRREFSAELARRRPFVATTALASGGGRSVSAYWAGRTVVHSEWRLPLWNGRVLNWLRAAHYETFGARSRGFFTITLVQVLFIAVFAYYLGEPAMVAYIPFIGIMSGYRLSGTFLYPLARSDRAKISYAASLLQTATISALSSAALVAMYALEVKVEPGRHEQTLRDAIPLVLFFVTWVPLGQLGNIGGRPTQDMFVSVRPGLTMFALLFGWMVLAILSHSAYAEAALFARFPYGTRIALICVLIAITQAAYWHALRWYYGRRDIVFTAPR